MRLCLSHDHHSQVERSEETSGAEHVPTQGTHLGQLGAMSFRPTMIFTYAMFTVAFVEGR